jgi:hypothetical protein
MYRLFLVSAVVLAFAAWTAGPVLAQAGGDYQLPPVKLKPDRPTTAKPIPPTPDDRTPPPPAEKPPEPPPPPTPPAPPAEKPPETPPAAPPTPPTPPPMPPIEKPPEMPPMPPLPPVEKPPEMPPMKPAEKPVTPAKPTAKPTPPVETPMEAPPKEAPPVVAKPAPKPPAPVETPVMPAPKEAPPVVTEPPMKAVAPTDEPIKSAPIEPPVGPPPVAKPLKTTPPSAPATVPATAPASTPPAGLPPLPPIPPDLARAMVAQEGPPKAGNPSDVQMDMAEAQVRPAPRETDLRGLGEVGLAEELTRTRKAYDRALLALRDYYTARGTAVKLGWVDSEIQAFDKVPKIMYLTVAEIAGPNLRPIRRIEAADQLYEEGMQNKNYPAMPFPMSNPGKDAYLKKALEKFQTIIERYPESDKIDDAAFRMGEVYSGWYYNDPTRAVECYERCWTWNPKTEHPALFNTAKIYEEKLNNRTKAVELYNRVLAESANEELQKQAADRIRALTGK